MKRSSLASFALGSVAITALFLSLAMLPLAQPHATATQQKSGTQLTSCGAMDSPFGEAPCLLLFFSGEISAGQKFERKFGQKLLFRLNPAHAQGWTLEIIPETQDQSGEREYVWVVTPPYRFYNVRYLETVYGVTAEQAVQESPRDFNFVLNEEQFKRAGDLVDLAVMSRPQSENKTKEELDRESGDAARTLAALPVSKGRLTILDSKIRAATSDKDPGSIQWLKFKVELQVPCDFATAPNAEIAIDANRCDGERKNIPQN